MSILLHSVYSKEMLTPSFRVDVSWMDILAEKNKLEDMFPLKGKGKRKGNGTLNLRIRYVNLRNLRDAKVRPPALSHWGGQI